MLVCLLLDLDYFTALHQLLNLRYETHDNTVNKIFTLFG
jgi:hypothetical protein